MGSGGFGDRWSGMMSESGALPGNESMPTKSNCCPRIYQAVGLVIIPFASVKLEGNWEAMMGPRRIVR